MAITLRIVLILMALMVLFFVIRKIRKASLRIEASIFWVIFSLLLVIMALFPELSALAARILGVTSPANLVFAFIIFLLLIKGFSQSIEISTLERKLETLTRRIALEEKENEEKHTTYRRRTETTNRAPEIRRNI